MPEASVDEDRDTVTWKNEKYRGDQGIDDRVGRKRNPKAWRNRRTIISGRVSASLMLAMILRRFSIVRVSKDASVPVIGK